MRYRIYGRQELIGQNLIESKWTDLAVKLMAFIVIPWSIWATATLFEMKAFANRGDRFTTRQAFELENRVNQEMIRINAKLDDRINQLPREEWRQKITESIAAARTVEKMVHEFEKGILKDFVRKEDMSKILRAFKEDKPTR